MQALALQPREGLTVKQMLDLFDQHHISNLKDPRSVRCLMKNYLTPLHDRQFASLTVLDIVAWANANRKRSEKQANAAIKLLRNVYNRAIEWDLYDGVNMATRVRVSARSKRSQYIKEHEMPKAMQAIGMAKFPDRLFFTAMLVLAPRPKELEFMQVQDVSLRREGETWVGEWTKPAARTKTKKEHIVPLPPQLASMFADWLRVRPPGTPWVFPGRTEDKPMSKEGWYSRWDALRTKVGLEHIWLYDLRRTGSTWAVDESGNLAAVSRGMLGHANYQETSRYVQTMAGPIKQVLASHETRLMKCAPSLQWVPDSTVAPRTTAMPPAVMDDRAMEWPG